MTFLNLDFYVFIAVSISFKVQFNIIQQQQEMYFAMEQDILDAIFAATDNSWKWSFEHRNEIERQISAAQQAMAEEMFNMQVSICQALYFASKIY